MAERGWDTRSQHMRVVRELKGPRPVSRCQWGKGAVLGLGAWPRLGHSLRLIQGMDGGSGRKNKDIRSYGQAYLGAPVSSWQRA